MSALDQRVFGTSLTITVVFSGRACTVSSAARCRAAMNWRNSSSVLPSAIETSMSGIDSAPQNERISYGPFIGVHPHTLHAGVVLNGLDSVFDPYSRCFESLPRRHRRHRSIHVQPNRASIELPGESVSARKTVRPHPSGQAEDGVIGHANEFFLCLERNHCSDRTENLLLYNSHVIVNISQDCRRIEVTGKLDVRASSSRCNCGTLLYSDVNI